MACSKNLLAAFLMLGASCFAQAKFDDGPNEIKDVLSKAHVSGSVVYSDECKFAGAELTALPSVYAPRSLGSPFEVLQQMFSGDSRMHVTQDPNGTIRMVQPDVPTDILDVKIHRVAFDSPRRAGPDPLSGADRALAVILSSPEVVAFKKEHQIVPTNYPMPSFERPDLPAVHGELKDVTLSQALDYVLKTFQGYWIYENCTTDDGRRTVNFRFY